MNTLELIAVHCPKSNITVCREISKKFEHYVSGNCCEVYEYFKSFNIKGEFVIVIKPSLELEISDLTIKEQVIKLMEQGFNKKDAIKSVSKSNKLNKNEVYQQVISLGDK
jgi:16S rRNA (cytidine1402-2'-O)-methyltransferase